MELSPEVFLSFQYSNILFEIYLSESVVILFIIFYLNQVIDKLFKDFHTEYKNGGIFRK